MFLEIPWSPGWQAPSWPTSERQLGPSRPRAVEAAPISPWIRRELHYLVQWRRLLPKDLPVKYGGFPEIGVPPNHTFIDGISHYEPFILGTPIHDIHGNPHLGWESRVFFRAHQFFPAHCSGDQHHNLEPKNVVCHGRERAVPCGSFFCWVEGLFKATILLSGWWFGTFLIFPCIGNNHPNWLISFRGVQTTNHYRCCLQVVSWGVL